MELLQLKYFKTVAECGKLKTAAEELFVSSPALSASIARLEKDLGVELFDRSNNRIVLNEQGKIFLNYVNRVFANLESAKLDMFHSLEKRSVNIQLAVSTSNIWMEMLAAYGVKRPDVTISESVLRLSHLKDIDMLNRYVFLLADREDQSQPDLESEVLFVDRPYVMLPKDHPMAQRKYLVLSEIADQVMFLPIPGQSLNHRIRSMFTTANLPVHYASEFSSETCRFMVAQGRGISITTQYAPRVDAEVCYVPLRDPIRWEQRLYWHKNRVLTAEELAFKDFIIHFFKNRASGSMHDA